MPAAAAAAAAAAIVAAANNGYTQHHPAAPARASPSNPRRLPRPASRPQGELAAQFAGKTVLLGVDDMDVFKGIELKLQVCN